MEPTIRLWFLGTPRAEFAGRPIQGFESRKAFALLGYLASQGAALPRAQLAALFWPDHSDERARANMRSLIHNLTNLLPGCLAVDRQTVRLLGTPACWIDTVEFEQLAAQNTLAALAAAADLYRSAFLDGLYFDDCPEMETWLTQQREHWHERAAQVLTELTARAHERQEWATALRSVDRLLTLDPWREAAHQDKMRLLALSGQRDSALAQYEICRRVLADELGIDPSPATSALYEQIRDNLLNPPAAPKQPRSFLPIPPTSLLGRADELAQLTTLLTQPGCRLLTVLGPGGVGKTRLALALATQEQARFADGAWLVELAAIRDPALVAPAIAQTLGLTDGGERPASERLKAWLPDKQLLLLLDNVEQLVAAAPLVGELLAISPQLTILVTSRVPLHLRGEQEFSLGPLRLPDLERLRADAASRVDLLFQAPASALFVERTRAVKPDFTVTEANALAIAEICARLDGLPLAIELAAARSKLFPPALLLARLEQRLPLLTSTTRDRPAHQQTIRSTIAWSEQLLDPPEQALFARLGVFVGGWTLELAEAVLGADTAGLNILDGITTLVDHSLVRQHLHDADEPRFMLLETIREYALEQLVAAGAAEATRHRHLAVYLALAQDAALGLAGPSQPAWLARLAGELDNLRAALHWAFDSHRIDDALRLASALELFWENHGLQREGRRWLEAGLALPAAVSLVRAQAYLVLGDLAIWDIDNAQARTYFEQALALFRQAGERRESVRALYKYGTALISQTEYASANRLLAEALADAQALGDRQLIGEIYGRMGLCAALEGDTARALPLLEPALAHLRQHGAPQVIALYLVALAFLRIQAHDPARAEALYREALGYLGMVRGHMLLAVPLLGLAYLALHQGNIEHVAQLMGAIEAHNQRLGMDVFPMLRPWHSAMVEAIHNQLAEDTAQRAWAAGRRLNAEQAVALALGGKRVN